MESLAADSWASICLPPDDVLLDVELPEVLPPEVELPEVELLEPLDGNGPKEVPPEEELLEEELLDLEPPEEELLEEELLDLDPPEVELVEVVPPGMRPPGMVRPATELSGIADPVPSPSVPPPPPQPNNREDDHKIRARRWAISLLMSVSQYRCWRHRSHVMDWMISTGRCGDLAATLLLVIP